MRRNCPHCGQEQVIPDEEIVAPWVFTRCHGCENLSIVTPAATGSPVSPAVAPMQKREASAAPLARKTQGPRSIPVRSGEVRAEAVLGAFATAARERPESFRPPIFEDGEKEWQLPQYFSPFTAESEKVVFKPPPATPAFLKKKKDPPQESALEPLAQAIREEAKPVAEPSELEKLLADAEPPSTQDSSGFDRQDAPPPGGGGGSSKRKQRIMGAGVLLIGIGMGLLTLKAKPRAPEPEPEPIPAFAPPQPAAYAPVRPAPVQVPSTVAEAPEAEAAPEPAPAPQVKRAPSGFWIVSVTGVKTSLRAGPGKQFKILGPVDTGSRWKVRKWDGEWFQVEPENLMPGTLGIGWIRNDLVKPEGNGGSS